MRDYRRDERKGGSRPSRFGDSNRSPNRNSTYDRNSERGSERNDRFERGGSRPVERYVPREERGSSSRDYSSNSRYSSRDSDRNHSRDAQRNSSRNFKSQDRPIRNERDSDRGYSPRFERSERSERPQRNEGRSRGFSSSNRSSYSEKSYDRSQQSDYSYNVASTASVEKKQPFDIAKYANAKAPFILVTTKAAYVLDSVGKVIHLEPVTIEDLKLVMRGEVSPVEQKLLDTHKGKCANHKNGQDDVPAPVLGMLLSQVEHAGNYDAYITLVKQEITQSIHWDTLLCQAIRSAEEIDTIINMLAKRLREWYEWSNPEFSRSIPSHEKFAELIITQGPNASEMGVPFDDEAKGAMLDLATQVVNLAQLRDRTQAYIQSEMTKHLPNTTMIAGALVGAKLLSLAGSVNRLVRMTASTLQVLGAEKALFRHLKTGARPPKHGIIFQHPLISKSKDKGKTARLIANALAISIKSDYFKTNSNVGPQLLADIERKVSQ